MAKNKVLDATNGVVALLQNLEAEERARALDAALSILGDPPRSGGAGGTNDNGTEGSGRSTARGQSAQTAKAFMDTKDPKTKVEELAVAAGFRELFENAEATKKEDFRKTLTAARRDFDQTNFGRDLGNARTAGLFNKGGDRGSAVLSHYGQKYVGTLPDREALKKLAKPKGAGRKAPRKSRGKRSLGR